MGDAAVVVGTSYRAGPWGCRSLKRAGWRVVGLHPVDDGHGRSTACFSPRRCPSPIGEPAAFASAVAAVCREVGAAVVLPLTEECVAAMAVVGPDLGATVLVGPDADQYAALCDKAALGASAARAGVGRPASATVSAGGREGEWPPLPSVVKTRGGLAPHGGSSAVRVDTAAERERAVAALIEAGVVAIVEELVVAPQWTVHAVRAADGTFDAVAAQVERTVPRRTGTPSVLTLWGPDHPTAEATRRLLDLVDYRGPGNAQFFVRDGEVMVHDVNLRLPASVALALRAGLDLPARGVDAALGRPLGAVRAAGPGLRYVSIGDEVRALLARHAPGANGPPPREVARDIVRGALSADTMLDPPLRDPLWIGADLIAAARGGARRALRSVM